MDMDTMDIDNVFIVVKSLLFCLYTENCTFNASQRSINNDVDLQYYVSFHYFFHTLKNFVTPLSGAILTLIE